MKVRQQSNFASLDHALRASLFDRRARFLNFGYEPLPDQAVAGPRLGPGVANRESARLLFELVGPVELRGGRVVEVGCGRGGNLATLARHQSPAALVGLDLSAELVAHGRDDPDLSAVRWSRADAEELPLRDGAVDAVVSVETSCTYPDLGRFYREVARVLAPGGWFLYTDLLDRRLLGPVTVALAALGLVVDHHRDISANVLAARAARAERQASALRRCGGGDDGFAEYVAEEGSNLHHALASGDRSYRLWRARRDQRPVPPEPVLSPAAQTIALEQAEHTAVWMAGEAPSP